MHELSIALSIVEMAAEQAQRHTGRVVGIHLRLGPLAGVVKEALLSAYELAAAESFAEVPLIVEDVPITARCPQCCENRPVQAIDNLRCAVCGTPTADIVSGRELELVALEIA